MRTWVAIVATAVATALAVHVVEVGAAETVVSATRFQLVDQTGTPRGYFGFLADGSGPTLTLCDAADGPCTVVDRNGFVLRDPAGNVRARIAFDGTGKARLDLCDENDRACSSVDQAGVFLYADSGAAQVQTVGLVPGGLLLAYPGAGTFTEREAATLTTGASPDGEFAALTVGARGDASRFRFSPVHGAQMAAGRPSATEPAPYADVSVTGGGFDRAILSNAKKALSVLSTKGKVRFSK